MNSCPVGLNVASLQPSAPTVCSNYEHNNKSVALLARAASQLMRTIKLQRHLWHTKKITSNASKSPILSNNIQKLGIISSSTFNGVIHLGELAKPLVSCKSLRTNKGG